MSDDLASIEQQLESAQAEKATLNAEKAALEAEKAALNAKMTALEAEKAALDAVTVGEENPPEGVDAKTFKVYKSFSASSVSSERDRVSSSLVHILSWMDNDSSSRKHIHAQITSVQATITKLEQKREEARGKKLSFKVLLKYDGSEKVMLLENVPPTCSCSSLLNRMQNMAMKDLGVKLTKLAVVEPKNVAVDTTADAIASSCELAAGHYSLEVSGEVDFDYNTFFERMVVSTFEDMLSAASSTTSTVRVNMRQKLLAANKTYEHCTVLEQVSKEIKFPKGCMSVGAHIIRRAKQLDSSLILLSRLGLDEDLHGPRNGIIMTRSLEVQFDRLMWCFVPCPDSTVVKEGMIPFRVKVFGYQPLVWEEGHPRINMEVTRPNEKQAKRMPIELVNKDGATLCESGISWGDLEGPVIHLPESISTTALMFHATATHIKHQCANRLQLEQYNNPKQHSPPMETKKKIADYLRTIEPVA